MISGLPFYRNWLLDPNVVHSRARMRALLVLFTITLVLGLLFIGDYPGFPIGDRATYEFPTPDLTYIHEPSPDVTYIGFVSDAQAEGTQAQVMYHPFTPSPPSHGIADHSIRPIRSHRQFSDECLERWVAHGRWDGPCRRVRVEEAVIDLAWVWVNGSDPLHARTRSHYLSAAQRPRSARFREHDELRYSMRSAAEATRFWKESVWHVITADVPHPDDDTRRLGLVPQWLDVNSSAIGQLQTGRNQPLIHLIHDSQLFRLLNSTDDVLTKEQAAAWRHRVLPTFNSHSIESQLPHLDPDSVSDNIVSLNDDQFLTLPLVPASFHTALYGPVFRFEAQIQVYGDASGRRNGDGEWRSLGWSAHLINQRFGTRKRAYVAHNARSFSLPLMHEASLAFPAVFSATPFSRFRGSHRDPAKGEIEVNTVFLTTHWVMERKREALLWSYIVAKWGGERGTLSVEDKRAMWLEMGGTDEDYRIRIKYRDRRTTPDDADDNLRAAGLQSTRVPDRNAAAYTAYSFVSQDGYPTFMTDVDLSNQLSRTQCLGEDEGSAWELFLNVLRTNPQCGDAIIHALTKQEGGSGGLSIFLPPGDSTPSESSHLPLSLPLILPSSAPPLPTSHSNLRAFAVRLFQRYSYAVGDTPARFFGLSSARQGKQALEALGKDIAFLCINDDLPDNSRSDEVEQTDDMLREWFENRWGVPAEWEGDR